MKIIIRMTFVIVVAVSQLIMYGCSEDRDKKKDVSMSTTDMIAAQRQLRELQLSDPHRPTYHFVNPEGRGMPFDPNGAIFWNGRYHLFYIFQDLRLITVVSISEKTGYLGFCELKNTWFWGFPRPREK